MFLVLAPLSVAGSVSLAWDPCQEPELLGYRLSYGLASGSYSTHVDVGNVTTHTVSNLPAGTYYFAVKAYSADMESAYSNEASATVPDAPDVQPPSIINVTSSGISSTGATLTWTTNEAADSQVEYGISTSYGNTTTLSGSMATSHSQALTGLSASTTYNYRVKSRDAAGNLATSGNYTFTTSAPPDTTPPNIANVAGSGISSTGVTLTWTTNEASDSQIEYGTSTSYGSNTSLNISMVTAHSQALSGLSANTTYNYRVKSRDAAGNLATSANYTFTTSAPPDTTPPNITNVVSSGITSTGATFTWTTNEAADSQIEYGISTSYGNTTTLNGSMVTSHSQALSGLSASTAYNYRVRSRDAAGNLATSANYTFTTSAPPDTTPPNIANVASSGITATGVTLAWTTNEAADSQIEYGISTSYGSNTTLNISMVTSHSQALSGLSASTTYNYRVKSRDAAGNLAASSNYTFTTSAPPDTTPPNITNVVSSGITATGANLAWTTNEASDSQVEYGTSTSYGSTTTLNGSMLTSHSQALSGLSASTTYNYRVKSRDAAGNLATSGNYTFTTSAAPDTTPPNITNVASSGITSTGANLTWTTNEASDSQVEYGTSTSYGSTTTLNGSMLTSHSQALSGLSASTTYNYRVRSRDVAGNLATSGNYTFTTSAPPDTTPPNITNVASSGITSTGATLAWTTNEAADTQVEYGTSTSYGSTTSLNGSMLTSHSQVLSGLSASTTYNYRVKSRDAAGNLATSGNYTFATSAAPDTTPPNIANVASSGITSTGATLAWTTNEAADTQVEYGTSTSYGSTTTLNGSMLTSHSQVLSGLSASTTYNYRVKSRDAAGNLATSGNYTFTTSAAPDTTPPNIANVASSGITATGATLTWTTDEASDSQVEYGTSTSYGSSTMLNGSMVTSHSQALSGLSAGTTYNYRVRSRDAAGNLATSGNYTFTTSAAPDTTPPNIANVASSGITATCATLTWTTDEASDSQVEYGTSTSYGSTTMLNGSMLTSHSQALSGLSAGTTYNYRVRSRDAAGNLATSGNYTFTTSAAPDTTPPNIANVASSGITSTGATLTWTTDEASDSQVEYGTSTSYGSTTTLNGSMLTSHSQALSGLSASTTYNYRVRSRDAAGNLATSGNYTFTTSAGLDTTPPNIANVASSGITATGATITWATNEAADSQVEYETSTSYGSSTMLNGSRVTSHSQTLTDLTANTTYHYRVKSRDVAGNLAISTNYVFTTSDPNDTGDLIISNIVSSAISTTQVAITWTTNLPASSEVEYGMTGSYGDSAVPTSSTRSARLTNSGDSPARSGNRRTATTSRLATSHSVTLSRLTPGTTYHYKVKSMDAESNLAASGDRTFATTIPDITAGLVAAYTFDEGQGSTIEDLSGSGNTASIYSADWTSGKYGNAVSFNGSNSYISAGTNRLPAINEPKTVSFWAKIPKKNSSTKTILALANSALETSLKQSLKNTQTGVVDAENRWNVVGKLPSIGAWHHFGYIFDGTHSHLYIDGIMAGRSMIALSAAPVTCFQIGRQADGSEYFEGSIDDLRIYARALTIEELAQAMNTPLAQSGAADVPAVAIVSEEIDLPIGSAYQPSEFPVVDLGLERRSYLQGDLVQTSALWISSPSTQSRDVELKMWIELPGLQPMPLRGLKVGDKLSLAPGYNHNFGIMPLLEISKEAPSGVCRVGARLIDPVSGTVLSESIQVFTIASEKNTRPKSHPAASESSRITIASYMENSRLYYVITNNGSSYAEIEAKLWFEFADGTVIQDFSIGAEGSLALAPKASITLTSSQIPEGAYKIKARLLNANTGALLAEAVQ